jgi:uncharacterized protein (DUF1501 family)
MAAPILVVVFLRGGADGLNLISPSGDADFIAARPEELRVLRSGDGAGHLLSDQAADVDFRFHPQAKGLSELFEARELAVIHASGLTDGTRSHFDAEDRMERAVKSGGAGGWIGRWLRDAKPEGILTALAVGSMMPESIRGSTEVALADELQQLILAGGSDFSPLLVARLKEGFGRHPLMQAPVARLISLSDTLKTRLMDSTGNFGPYVPSVDYPSGDSLPRAMMTVAQAIKLDLGLRVATVDFGGWDTHDDQSGQFAGLVDQLSQSLLAFWRDIGDRQENVTVVVQSEFGRRLRANSNRGTDHGFGNAMMVLGSKVNGGRMLGTWPGLKNDVLDSGADLAITTDYRHILAEIMTQHMQSPNSGISFPDFVPESRGVFRV